MKKGGVWLILFCVEWVLPYFVFFFFELFLCSFMSSLKHDSFVKSFLTVKETKINLDCYLNFQIFEGYFVNEFNTDNAWLETVIYNFHDEQNIIKKFLLAVSILCFALLLKETEFMYYWSTWHCCFYQNYLQKKCFFFKSASVFPNLKTKKIKHYFSISAINIFIFFDTTNSFYETLFRNIS